MLFLLLTIPALAQPPTAPDPIAAELAEVKTIHRAAVGQAKDELTRAFDAAEKSIRDDAGLKAEQQVDLLRQHRKEREAFAADGTLPASPRMKTAAAEYRGAVAAADKQLHPARTTRRARPTSGPARTSWPGR